MNDFDVAHAKSKDTKRAKTGVTRRLRKLEVGDKYIETERTSEIYIFAKRLGIKIKTEKAKKGLTIIRLK